MSETKAAKVELDWSRLLGFDQAHSRKGAGKDVRRFGVKPGIKSGIKVSG
jgi:hypothetical protein